MKGLLYIIGIAGLACGVYSCQSPELQTEIIENSFSTALEEGSCDSLHMDLMIEWPVKGLPPVAMQNIQRGLMLEVLGKECITGTIEDSIEEYRTIQENEYRNSVNDLRQSLMADVEDGIYSWSETMEGRFMEPYKKLQSYLLYTYGYTGGAHGIDSKSGFTFNLSDGKKVSEKDIFVHDYKPTLARLLSEQLPHCISKNTYDMLFIKSIEPNNNFYVEPEGITYIYERYEIGPYSSGIVEITIPWSKLDSILK